MRLRRCNKARASARITVELCSIPRQATFLGFTRNRSRRSFPNFRVIEIPRYYSVALVGSRFHPRCHLSRRLSGKKSVSPKLLYRRDQLVCRATRPICANARDNESSVHPLIPRKISDHAANSLLFSAFWHALTLYSGVAIYLDAFFPIKLLYRRVQFIRSRDMSNLRIRTGYSVTRFHPLILEDHALRLSPQRRVLQDYPDTHRLTAL